jgi:hypothetical protein
MPTEDITEVFVYTIQDADTVDPETDEGKLTINLTPKPID